MRPGPGPAGPGCRTVTMNLFQVPREHVLSISSSSEARILAPAVHSALTCTGTRVERQHWAAVHCSGQRRGWLNCVLPLGHSRQCLRLLTIEANHPALKVSGVRNFTVLFNSGLNLGSCSIMKVRSASLPRSSSGYVPSYVPVGTRASGDKTASAGTEELLAH